MRLVVSVDNDECGSLTVSSDSFGLWIAFLYVLTFMKLDARARGSDIALVLPFNGCLLMRRVQLNTIVLSIDRQPE
ncbi:hypothetical protein JAAARDRAFT_41390 [Jaapia argillacea MUCL 33604]|uniref:Uncharacterized protein n=1 Tax=Jaapia argillacea MUCL 33604 TaxID=933084 RepID=A0A067PKX8_9AGAM|nr:hypothetical protein JAAARDRAFT_41390 [Jaapia argillacea MUCL 33604]